MTDIRKVIKETKRIVFGRDKSLSLLKHGKLEEVFLSSDFPETKQIQDLAKLSDAKVTAVKHTNDELGALCRKPFSISMIGLKKEK